MMRSRSLNMSFVPGQLELKTTERGEYVVRLQNADVLRTLSAKAALAKYNAVRMQMETLFPAPNLTPEQRAELWRRHIADSLVGHNSFKEQPKKRRRGSTRTFG
jgi:hypothetical protein